MFLLGILVIEFCPRGTERRELMCHIEYLRCCCYFVVWIYSQVTSLIVWDFEQWLAYSNMILCNISSSISVKFKCPLIFCFVGREISAYIICLSQKNVEVYRDSWTLLCSLFNSHRSSNWRKVILKFINMWLRVEFHEALVINYSQTFSPIYACHCRLY